MNNKKTNKTMNNVVANGTWLMNHTSVDNTMTVAEALE